MRHTALLPQRCGLALVLALSGPVVAQDSSRPAPRSEQVVVDLQNALAREIKEQGRILPATAARVVGQLCDSGIDPAALPAQFRPLYWRALAWAAPVAGELPLALEAARQWRQIVPDDLLAGRAMLQVQFLLGDADAAREVLESLDKPANQQWQPWLRYMAGLLPLAGQKPAAALALGGDQLFDVQKQPGRVVVLDFWSSRTGGVGNLKRQAQWWRMYQDQPVSLLGVNIDSSAELADARRLADQAQHPVPQHYPAEHADTPVGKLGITQAPTVVVLGPDGAVLFAGEPTTWEPHTAIAYGLTRVERSDSRSGTRPSAAAAGGGPAPPTPPRPRVPAPTEAEQAQAQKLFDEGFDLLRLGRKAANPTFRQRGTDMLEECIRRYPNTRAAQQAAQELGR